MHGLVKCFNPDRGFGFIEPLIGKPGTAQAVFFHKSALARGINGLPIGARVNFKLIDGTDGRPQAACIKLVEAKVKRLFKPLEHREEQAGIPDRTPHDRQDATT